MLRHVVMFRWADDVGAEHIEAVAAGLDGLVPAIPQIKSYRHGPDAGLAAQNYDYVVVGDFESADDYAVYRDHPIHEAFIAELIVGRVADRAAVQYQI
jgi:hypothetical protein